MARCVCCRSSEEGGLSASVRAVIVLGCALGLAFIFLLVAGIRYHNWSVWRLADACAISWAARTGATTPQPPPDPSLPAPTRRH